MLGKIISAQPSQNASNEPEPDTERYYIGDSDSVAGRSKSDFPERAVSSGSSRRRRSRNSRSSNGSKRAV